MNRDDDRRDHARERETAPPQRNRNIREQVGVYVQRMRQQARAGDSSGAAIDSAMDRIASEQAPHTRGGAAEDTGIRNDLESHRREMELGTVAGAQERRAAAHKVAANAPTIGARAKLHDKAEKEYRQSPGGQRRPAPGKTVRVHSTRTKPEEITRAARQGARIETRMTNTERVAQGRRDADRGVRTRGTPAPKRARPTHVTTDRSGAFALRPANMGAMRIGGNADQKIAYATHQPISRETLDQRRAEMRKRASADDAPRLR